MAKLNTNAPTIVTTHSSASFGIRFSAPVQVWATHVWINKPTGHTFPARIGIMSVTGVVEIISVLNADLTWVAQGGDWYRAELPTYPNLPSTDSYSAAYCIETGQGAEVYSVGAPTPDSPLVWIGGAWSNGNTLLPGNNLGSTYCHAFDLTLVTVDPGPGGGGPTPPAEPPDEEPDPGTVDPGGSLPYWLDTRTVNPNSLPKVNNDRLNEIKALLDDEVGNIIGMIGSTSSSGGGSVMGRLGILLPLVTALAAVAADVSTILANVNGPGNTLEDMATKLENLYVANTIEAGRNRIPITDPAWLLVDDLVGQGSKVWLVGADKIVWTATAWGAQRNANQSIDGLPYYLHRGFWAPLVDDLVGEYRTIVGFKHILEAPPSKLHGVLLHVDDDIEWTLQAYNFVGNP